MNTKLWIPLCAIAALAAGCGEADKSTGVGTGPAGPSTDNTEEVNPPTTGDSAGETVSPSTTTTPSDTPSTEPAAPSQ